MSQYVTICRSPSWNELPTSEISGGEDFVFFQVAFCECCGGGCFQGDDVENGSAILLSNVLHHSPTIFPPKKQQHVVNQW